MHNNIKNRITKPPQTFQGLYKYGKKHFKKAAGWAGRRIGAFSLGPGVGGSALAYEVTSVGIHMAPSLFRTKSRTRFPRELGTVVSWANQ